MTSSTVIVVDTSVAIPLVLASHVAHDHVRRWAHGKNLVLAGHAALETYAVLTRLPGDARVAPDDAIHVLDANFGEPLHPTAPPQHIPKFLAARGIAGGATYDGLVALTAADHGATLATRDARALPTYQAMGIAVQLLTDA